MGAQPLLHLLQRISERSPCSSLRRTAWNRSPAHMSSNVSSDASPMTHSWRQSRQQSTAWPRLVMQSIVNGLGQNSVSGGCGTGMAEAFPAQFSRWGVLALQEVLS